jgi:hypothetical protein
MTDGFVDVIQHDDEARKCHPERVRSKRMSSGMSAKQAHVIPNEGES